MALFINRRWPSDRRPLFYFQNAPLDKDKHWSHQKRYCQWMTIISAFPSLLSVHSDSSNTNIIYVNTISWQTLRCYRKKQINSPIVALLSLNSFNNSMNNNPNTLWIPITINWLKKDAGTTSQLKPLSRVVLEQTSRFITEVSIRDYTLTSIWTGGFGFFEPPAKRKSNRWFHARIPSAYTVSTIRCSIT